jgi:hypothetical protein
MSTIEERAAQRERELRERTEGQRRLARPEDYVFDKAQEMFWDLRDGTLHTEKALDASIPIELWRVEVEEAPAEAEGAAPRRGRPRQRRERLVPPSRDVMRVENDQFVEGSTWWPGKPPIIKDWFIDKDGFYPAFGRRVYNQYKAPPDSDHGDAEGAGPWVEHVKKLWPDEKEHEFFFNYFAHMIQRPQEKCNAAIVLSGTQGIGKDAALAPIKAAVGSWNTKGIDPDELFSPYRPWLQTLMLVVDEVRPTKDEFHASSMYNILKPMIVAPPDTLPLNDKYQKLRYVINVLRVVITTNDWMAMYIPAEDRRMFIMHSTLPQRWNELEGKPDYFMRFFAWLEAGGAANVAAWLAARDLSNFNPKAQVEKTMGWEAVANTWGEPDDAVGLALEALGAPSVVFGSELLSGQFDGAEEVGNLLKSPRKIGHRMQRSGYLAVKPPGGEPRWVFRADGQTFRSRLVFVKQELMRDPGAVKAAISERGAAILREPRNVTSGNPDKAKGF